MAPADEDVEPLDVASGINRVVWDLKGPGPVLLDDAVMSLGYTGGVWMPPGEYTVRLTAGGAVREQVLELRPDPRLPGLDPADLTARYELAAAVRDRATDVHAAIRRLRSVRDQLEATAARVEAARPEDDALVREVRQRADSIARQLDVEEEALIQTRNVTGQDPLNFPPKLDNQLIYLYGHVNEAYGRPTEGARERWGDLQGAVAPHLDRIAAILRRDVSAFNRFLAERGLDGVLVPR